MPWALTANALASRRAAALQEGLRQAVAVPLALAETVASLWPVLRELALCVNLACRSDLQVRGRALLQMCMHTLSVTFAQRPWDKGHHTQCYLSTAEAPSHMVFTERHLFPVSGLQALRTVPAFPGRWPTCELSRRF